MLDKEIRTVSLCVAMSAGTLALTATFLPAVREIAVEPMLNFTVAVILILFVRMISKRTYREGIDKANREMQSDDPWPGITKKLSDSDWGIFGKKVGSPLLLNVRAVLFAGSIPAGLLQNLIGQKVFLLWFAGAMLSIELSLMFAALKSFGEDS